MCKGGFDLGIGAVSILWLDKNVYIYEVYGCVDPFDANRSAYCSQSTSRLEELEDFLEI